MGQCFGGNGYGKSSVTALPSVAASEDGSIAILTGANGMVEVDATGSGQYDDATGETASFNSHQDGVHTVSLRVTDDRNGTGTATVVVANLSPTAVMGGPYTGNEGSNIVLDGSGSFDPADDIVAYDWDLDGDGQYDDAAGVSVVFYTTDDGQYDIGLRVTDDVGADQHGLHLRHCS